MPNDDRSIDRLQAYVRQLTPQARGRLLAELERLHLVGDDMPGCGELLAELRAEFRKGGQTNDRIGNPSRFFFHPLEPMLVSAPAEATHAGQISRGSLAAIWEWINEALLPAMAREYDANMRSAILANRLREAEQIAAAFQSKVAKCFENALNNAEGIERAKSELKLYTVSTAAVTDVEKILKAFRAREALAAFDAALPEKIAVLKEPMISTVRLRLDALRGQHPDALPFALFMIVQRMKRPWQLLHVIAPGTGSSDAVELADLPCAFAFTAVLGTLDASLAKLIEALRQNHALTARGILAHIYDVEYELRSRLENLERSEWGKQLDGVMAKIAAELDAEVSKLPDNLHHVLASPALHRHDNLAGRISWLIWRARGSMWRLLATSFPRPLPKA